MYNGNPNQSAYPLAPEYHQQSPNQPGYTNPYGYGAQRVLGQLAPQPNALGMGGGTNSGYQYKNGGYTLPQGLGLSNVGINNRGNEGTVSPGALAVANGPMQLSQAQYFSMFGKTPQNLGYSDFKNPMDYLRYLDAQGSSYNTGQSDWQRFQQSGQPPFSGNPYGY